MYSYSDYYKHATLFAKSLIHIGCQLKDVVSITGFNSPEYHFALHGTWLAGGVTAGIYTTNSEEATQYVLEHSESVVCVCQAGRQLQKLLSIREHVPLLKAIVVYWQKEPLPQIPEDSFARVYTWDDFLKLGVDVTDELVDERIQKTVPGSCATLIYTSGTTGDPKGVMCSHDSCTYNAKAAIQAVGLSDGERFVGYLPLNHVAAQFIDTMLLTVIKMTMYMARPDALKGTLTETLKKAKPTVFVGVPRVFEKMMDAIKVTFAKNSYFKQYIISWARDIGYRAALTRQYGKTYTQPWFYSIAKRLVFDTLRGNLGLENCHTMIVSAAPITEETLRFFASFDMPIYDLLGQSEGTAPVCTCSKVNQRWKIGTVGLPMPGVEVQTDPLTEEIVYRGRITMMGYLKQPQETLSTLDADGWIHTGDQGKKDEDGFLKVTGRLKELIVTAGGENVSPVIIETKVMEFAPIFSCCVAVGDKRKFISLLICLRCETGADGESNHKLAHDVIVTLQGLGSTATTVEEAMTDAKVKAYIDEVIAKYNKVAISRAQEIRKWCVVPHEFSVGKGELTATMKLRRAVVHEHYAKEIDAMYCSHVCRKQDNRSSKEAQMRSEGSTSNPMLQSLRGSLNSTINPSS